MKYIRTLNKYNCTLPIRLRAGTGLFFPHNFPVVINSAATIGENVIIHPNVLIGTSRNKLGAPIIGNNCFLGNGCKIIGNCCIGDWCFVTPGAFVTRDIPSNSIIGYGVNNILPGEGHKLVKAYLSRNQLSVIQEEV